MKGEVIIGRSNAEINHGNLLAASSVLAERKRLKVLGLAVVTIVGPTKQYRGNTTNMFNGLPDNKESRVTGH